ncbi:MAG TPA: hypothetical protein VH351_14340 [Bryobacteraceae bacterium]|nr:hypothetical protein [Bryobacteraceae bacterium]
MILTSQVPLAHWHEQIGDSSRTAARSQRHVFPLPSAGAQTRSRQRS